MQKPNLIRSAPEPKGQKRIFIVDDHPVFREGLVSIVQAEPAWTVCGQAESAAKALTEIERLKPDLVLADIALHGPSGLELIKDLRDLWTELVVLVISMHDERLYAERALRAGARGYIMKQEPPENLLEAMRQVLSGQMYLSPQISFRVLRSLDSRHRKGTAATALLTDRELEILSLIAQGEDSQAIGRRLNLSPKTVDAHRGHIKVKLKLRSGTELISYASRWAESHPVASEPGEILAAGPAGFP